MCSFCWSWLRYMVMLSEFKSEWWEADVSGDQLESQPLAPIPGCLGGFEMETISSMVEVVCCVPRLWLKVSEYLLRGNKDVSLELNVKYSYVSFWQCEVYDFLTFYTKQWQQVKILWCTKGSWFVIKIAGQYNQVYVQGLGSVEVLWRFLEHLRRSPWSPPIRCLALICLSVPEERSWSRCFRLPLLVHSFPREEERQGDGQSGRKVLVLLPASLTYTHVHPIYIYIWVCLSNRAVSYLLVRGSDWLGWPGIPTDGWQVLHTHRGSDVIEQAPERSLSMRFILYVVTVCSVCRCHYKQGCTNMVGKALWWWAHLFHWVLFLLLILLSCWCTIF